MQLRCQAAFGSAHSRQAGARLVAPQRCRSAAVQRSRRVYAAARALVRDAESGVEFPLGQKFWEGAECHCLGSVTRSKQILVIKAQLYSVALYVEGDLASKELGIRHRGGFFETDDDYCSALVDGAFEKVLVFRMLRDIDGQQFSDAVKEKLGPRITIMGETASMDMFCGFFTGVKLTKGTQVFCLWTKAGDLHVVVLDEAAAATTQLEKVPPQHVLKSQGFARALFELFLGEASIVPAGRAVWAAGAKELLESDKVKRDSRKAGSG